MSTPDHHTVVDMMGREVKVPVHPKRIVSLVPSQTELLYDLGLDEELVGITKFCVHPDSWFRSKTRVGGTKTPDLERIRALKPDLIIGNKEENEEESIKILEREFAVWMSDIYTLDDAKTMILELGSTVNKKTEAQTIVNQIKFPVAVSHNKSCLYFIWNRPKMIAGDNVFINDMLQIAGFENIFPGSQVYESFKVKKSNLRYPEISDEDIQSLNPEYILLSSEPFPFKEKHIAGFLKLCPQSKVIIVDGEMFSWYGSRMLKAGQYFRSFFPE